MTRSLRGSACVAISRITWMIDSKSCNSCQAVSVLFVFGKRFYLCAVAGSDSSRRSSICFPIALSRLLTGYLFGPRRVLHIHHRPAQQRNFASARRSGLVDGPDQELPRKSPAAD